MKVKKFINAAKEKEFQKVEEMIRTGYDDLDALDEEDNCALNYAIDNFKMAELLLTNNAKFWGMPHPILCDAVRNNKTELIDKILEMGTTESNFNVDESCNKTLGTSPLWIAVENQDLGTVKKLIEHQADAR